MAPARSSLARCVSLGLPRHPFQAVIESLGLDPAATCADRLILRLQPQDETHRGRRVRYLPPHRDTWGSNVMAQINLWGPVFPLEPGATMVIWPTLFGRPVPNTSADWDFEKLREAPGRYPLLPECRAPSTVCRRFRFSSSLAICCAFPGLICMPAGPTGPAGRA